MSEEEREKFRNNEGEKNPMGNFADGLNQAQFGNIGELARGGCFTNLLTIVGVIVILILLSQCSII